MNICHKKLTSTTVLSFFPAEMSSPAYVNNGKSRDFLLLLNMDKIGISFLPQVGAVSHVTLLLFYFILITHDNTASRLSIDVFSGRSIPLIKGNKDTHSERADFQSHMNSLSPEVHIHQPGFALFSKIFSSLKVTHVVFWFIQAEWPGYFFELENGPWSLCCTQSVSWTSLSLSPSLSHFLSSLK